MSKEGYEALAPSCEQNDVLSRYWLAYCDVTRTSSGYPAIVRVTGDCPLIDPEVVDRCVEFFHSSRCDYVSLGPTWPDGLDVEVFSFKSLMRALQHTKGHDREHVTPYMYRSGRFKIGRLDCPIDLTSERWCVDDWQDLAFVRTIYQALFPETITFGWRDLCVVIANLEINNKFPNRERRNQGYLTQAGITGTWEDFRFGESNDASS